MMLQVIKRNFKHLTVSTFCPNLQEYIWSGHIWTIAAQLEDIRLKKVSFQV